MAQRIVAWQPITGCSPISPGCKNCHGMKLAGGKLGEDASRSGLTTEASTGAVWSGKVRLNEPWLEQPIKSLRPSQVAVCSHGDLFHEAAPDEWLNRIFDVMERADWHVFQVLTKRPARMLAYSRARYGGASAPGHLAFGVSVERQIEADLRVPDLLQMSASTRFVTCYPLLSPIDFLAIPGVAPGELRSLAMVAIGDEAQRPADPAWARSIEAQMRVLGVPVTADGKLLDDDSAGGFRAAA